MPTGLLAGMLWGLDTVVLSVALSKAGFCSTAQAIALAPLVSTFFHDLFSSAWMIIFTTIKKGWSTILSALKTKSGRIIILGSLLGGPVGMTGYVCAVKYIGPAYTAVITAIYPAVGALLARIFLKERMRWYQFTSLLVSICCVAIMGYLSTGTGEIERLSIGFLCALLCVFGWASEAVICAFAMQNSQLSNEHALQIRQLTSAFTYGVVILPIVKGWHLTSQLFVSSESAIILLCALFGTASYLLYYRAIHKIGASRAMALNITYSAWAIVFCALLLHSTPTPKELACCIVIVISCIISAKEKWTDNRPISE